MKLPGFRRRCRAKSISAKDSPGSSPRPKPAKKASRSGIARTRHSQASLHHGPPPCAACSLTACRPSATAARGGCTFTVPRAPGLNFDARQSSQVTGSGRRAPRTPVEVERPLHVRDAERDVVDRGSGYAPSCHGWARNGKRRRFNAAEEASRPPVGGVRTASAPPEPLPEPAEQTRFAVRRHLRQPLRRHPAHGLVAWELLAHVL